MENEEDYTRKIFAILAYNTILSSSPHYAKIFSIQKILGGTSMDETKYLLALYDNADYEQVDDIFLELYKNGIPVKSTKDNYVGGVESLIAQSSAVLLVLSPASLASQSIGYHIQLAEQFNKHIIPYILADPAEEMEIPKDLFLKMDGSATIPAYEYAVHSALVQRALSELRPYFPQAFAPKKKKRRTSLSAILGTIVLCLAVITSYFAWIKPANTEKVLTHVKQSTVIIYTSDEAMENYSSGSGFFISDNGTIATNYHVIQDAEYVLVQPYAAEDYYLASVIAVDHISDLALLRIANTYTVTDYLSFSSKKVRVGDSIYVSGYPRGIDLTISNGIVSNNEHYAVEEPGVYYMITAAISPGNSGGPVVNESGKVIGIATAKYLDAENVNLARPVSYLEELLKLTH